jgi:hypothetical protein
MNDQFQLDSIVQQSQYNGQQAPNDEEEPESSYSDRSAHDSDMIEDGQVIQA